jgi:3-oxoadipate enol-lactonase
VAQSMGGWACLEYAIGRPERVRALVMADTVGTLSHPEGDRLIAEHAATHSRSAQYDGGAHPACGERMFREQPALHFLYTQVSGLTSPPPAPDFRDRLAALRTRPAEDLAKLRMPVLCIAGEEDTVIPPGAVQVLASLIPGALRLGAGGRALGVLGARRDVQSAGGRVPGGGRRPVGRAPSSPRARARR